MPKSSDEEWIDIPNGVVKPRSRANLNRLLATGTNGKFVGLYRRGGKATVRLGLTYLEGADAREVFVLKLISVEPAGDELHKWWP